MVDPHGNDDTSPRDGRQFNAASPSLFMTIAEVCRQAHVGRTFVYDRIAGGDLEANKFGRATRVRRTEFERWLGSFPTIQH